MAREKKLPPVRDPQIRQLDVQVYGERGYVVGAARIPVDLLGDFEAAWLAFRDRYPHYTLEQFLRYLFKKGMASASSAVWANSIPAPKIASTDD